MAKASTKTTATFDSDDKGPTLELSGSDVTITASIEDIAPAASEPWYVVDPVATKEEPRIHKQLVDGRPRAFAFSGEPLGMPHAIAVKFLRHEGFIRTDAKGNEIEYERVRQPEEFGAGERFVIKDDETVAKYSELTLEALLRRAAELPLGEQFSKRSSQPARQDIVDFIVRNTIEARKRNSSPEKRDDDEFEPDAEDEAA